jgi:predicted nucleic acid-binding protein
MATFLVDTDVLADFFNGRASAKNLIEKIQEQGEVFISILSISELRTGFSDSESKKYLPLLCQLAEIDYVTIEIAELAGKLRAHYFSKGISLSMVDTIIAASAITNNHKLITRNIKHYSMPEVKIFKIKN